MNFIDNLSNKNVSLKELQKGFDIITKRLDKIIESKTGPEQEHYLKIKSDMARAMGNEVESRRLDAEKEAIVQRIRGWGNMDHVMAQELAEERSERGR